MSGFGGAGGMGGSIGGRGGRGGQRRGTGGVAGTFGSGGSGGVGECVDQANSSCEVCLCFNCFSQYGACIGDFGCPPIIDCATRTGCQGIGCYRPDTCQGVIDAFGGPFGTSVAITQQLFSCARGSGCPCGL